jgi:hypothetical protein
LAHIRRMEKAVSLLGFLRPVISAAFVALWLAYIAHYGFGLSREEIRGAALVGAGVISALVAIKVFGKKLRKLK